MILETESTRDQNASRLPTDKLIPTNRKGVTLVRESTNVQERLFASTVTLLPVPTPVSRSAS